MGWLRLCLTALGSWMKNSSKVISTCTLALFLVYGNLFSGHSTLKQCSLPLNLTPP